jgi:hypothetical protein
MDIVYHNTQTDTKHQLKSKRFQKSTHKKNLITALPIEAIQLDTIYQSAYLNEDEFIKALSTNAYEILNLDSTKSHIIKYLKTDDRYRVFTLQKDSIDTTKYSYITYEPLAYQSLYINSIIDSEYVDCFIKIKKSQSFIVYYKNGQYLESKSIQDYLNEALFSSYELNFLTQLLSNYNENISKLVIAMLESLSSLLTLEDKRVNDELNVSINRVFIDFDTTISKEYFGLFREYLDSRVSALDIDTLGCDTTSAIYTSMLVKNYNPKLNFINTQKSANNPNYISKQAASIIVASAISLAYPLYLASEVVATKIETLSMKDKIKEIENDKQKLLSSVKRYIEYKESLQARVSTLESEKKEMLASINSMYKDLDEKKADILVRISDKLKITDIAIEHISLQEKNGTNILSLSLQSSNKGKIDFVIKSLAHLDIYRKSIYKYHDKYRANLEVII